MKNNRDSSQIIAIIFLIIICVREILFPKCDLHEKYFYMGFFVIFELYIFLKLPYSEYFWFNRKNSENLTIRNIRVGSCAALLALMTVSLDSLVLLEYLIFTLNIEDWIDFFLLPKKDKVKIFQKIIIPKIKELSLLFIGGLLILIICAWAFFSWYLIK